MRTLEVAGLDPKTGGAMRVAMMISLRRRIGVEDCRTLPIDPHFYYLTNVIITKALNHAHQQARYLYRALFRKSHYH